MQESNHKTALVIGASRTLGLALATELARRGWDVIGTVRGDRRTGLHDLVDSSDGRVTVEHVDTTKPEQISALRDRLSGRDLDLLFVNAGIAHANIPVGEVTIESFTEVMVTNALSPMRVIETLGPLVIETGTIAVMSSRQGSLTMNTNGGNEVYRASKSALNQLMRSYAARNADDPRTLLLVNPGWVRTGLGGPGALLEIDESIPGVVNTLEARAGERGLHFVDYENQVLPW
ncbi:NAD(P)-dependent dehydrogenase (short-subunit alcohol dehydrogenase family) [Streptomyces sp. SAI-117]|uniref:SDR family oxidoreductase n=1 Tax=unclassified Streptomyces TaxID=2593676 RepID=UPI002476C222|nr:MULTISPECIES: SDR family NAD(P)-dependent oxidoreductase [unclassified Streptomyces]MDH6573540.1 NAD(P)-dependent dehydrogenase (short-subunit alcohol dehydrogenase family) [Streptomyces sp. SAI-117]MDH6581723.1 NAD(P)-dependent dehydrogenase (short-subunit alcohol dehydrogenase family) [Streptomyces sp. SAI-133]